MTRTPKIIESQIDEIRFDPMRMQRYMLDMLGEAGDDPDLLQDASNPFVFLMEANATLGSASMAYTASITRRLYPEMAQTEEEIYFHMDDTDYGSRFSQPAATRIGIVISKDEVIANAVEDLQTGIRRITIPKNTNVNVIGMDFGIHYPVDIQVLANNSLRVLWDYTVDSPLGSKGSNIIDSDVILMDGREYLRFYLPMEQFSLVAKYGTVAPSTGFTETFDLKDNFYYARVYMRQSLKRWTEIKTTHSEQVHNPRVPTATLKVEGKILRVSLPQIYMSNKTVSNEIRVDIYTTKGKASHNLANYSPDAFSYRWGDLDDLYGGVFTAPLARITGIRLFSPDYIAGGRPALSLDELKDRITKGVTAGRAPVTNFELEAAMKDRGYEVVRDVDNITDRVVLATRELPPANLSSLRSSIGCAYHRFTATEEELVNSNLVLINGRQNCIPAGTLFEINEKVLHLVPSAEVNRLRSLQPVDQVAELNSRNLMYCPFHVVVDHDADYFQTRNYRLDSPVVELGGYVDHNVTKVHNPVTRAVDVVLTAAGWSIIVTVDYDPAAGTDYTKLFAQLAVKPFRESNYVYVNGSVIEAEEGLVIYQFDLQSTFHIDVNNRVNITNMRMYSSDVQEYRIKLNEMFSLVYSYERDALDAYDSTNAFVGHDMLDRDVTGLLVERIKVDLGEAMERLSGNDRTAVSEETYATYDADVDWICGSDVYELDENGLPVFTIDAGVVNFNPIYQAGDTLLDEQGNPVIKHYAGDIKLDASGNPIVIDNRKAKRIIDLVLLDARYQFANDADVVAYRDSIPKAIAQYINSDIAVAGAELIERTELLFRPKTTLGTQLVTTENKEVMVIDTAQPFTVTYHVSDVVYKDLDLRADITQTTRDIVAEEISKSTVSLSKISSALTKAVGDDILSVQIDPLDGERKLTLYTNVDRVSNTTVASRMVLTDDNVLTLEDALEVIFKQHVPS